MSSEESEQEQSQKVKVTDRRRFVLDDAGKVVERPDAPQREATTANVAAAAPQAPPAAAESPAADAAPADRAPAPGPQQAAPAPESPPAPGQSAEGDGEQASPEEAMATQIFLDFLNSLAHSLLVHLGETPDPGSGLVRENLEAAQQTLEVLGVIRKKTDGNLSQQEARVFDSLIYELMMRFRQKVEAMQKVPPPPGGPQH